MRHAGLGCFELVAQAGAELGVDQGFFAGEFGFEGRELVEEVVWVAEEGGEVDGGDVHFGGVIWGSMGGVVVRRRL